LNWIGHLITLGSQRKVRQLFINSPEEKKKKAIKTISVTVYRQILENANFKPGKTNKERRSDRETSIK